MITETGKKLEARSASGPFELNVGYHFEKIEDGTRITWTCHLSTGEPYRFVESMIGQVMVMETEISFTILKKCWRKNHETNAANSARPHARIANGLAGRSSHNPRGYACRRAVRDQQPQ
jgi:hypothetical protein